MMQYPQPSPIFFTGQQGRDFSRWLTIAQWLGTFLPTPVALSLFFSHFPRAWPTDVFSTVLLFLSCFFLIGWILFFQGIWSATIGCLLLIKPSAVRGFAQGAARSLPWIATSTQQLALNMFWLSFCLFALDGYITSGSLLLPRLFAQDSYISFGSLLLSPLFLYPIEFSALFLLGLCGFILIYLYYSHSS